MVSWFIAAAIILILELFIGSVYLLVVSAALFGAGLAEWIFTDTTISIFSAAILSAIGIWSVKKWLKHHRKITEEAQTSQDDLDVGQTVTIIQHLHDNHYIVMYRGTHWQAQASNHAINGDKKNTAIITGKNANVLLIQFC